MARNAREALNQGLDADGRGLEELRKVELLGDVGILAKRAPDALLTARLAEWPTLTSLWAGAEAESGNAERGNAPGKLWPSLPDDSPPPSTTPPPKPKPPPASPSLRISQHVEPCQPTPHGAPIWGPGAAAFPHCRDWHRPPAPRASDAVNAQLLPHQRRKLAEKRMLARSDLLEEVEEAVDERVRRR